jgi:hypothetical protein
MVLARNVCATAHEEVVAQREREELAEAWHRQYMGLPPATRQSRTDFASERDSHPDPEVEDSRKFTEAWINGNL